MLGRPSAVCAGLHGSADEKEVYDVGCRGVIAGAFATSAIVTATAFGAAPTVENTSGATGILATNATLNGNLTGGGTANVWIYYGTNDGATVKGDWVTNAALGLLGEGVFSVGVTGLTADTHYYYRCYGSNDDGAGWAATTTNFWTLVAAAFDDAAIGDYNANATWSGGTANPAGGAGDAVMINGYRVRVTGAGQMADDTNYVSLAGVLYVETGNSITYLDGSTVYLREGGRLRYPRTWVNATSTARVIADRGMAVFESADVQNGGLGSVMNCTSLLCTGAVTTLKLQVMTGAVGSSDPGIGFTNATFAVDTTVDLSTNRNHLQLHRVELASDRTVDVSGIGTLRMRAGNDSAFAGTVNWNSTGSIELRAGQALGSATFNLFSGTVYAESANCASGATLNVHTGVCVYTADYNGAGRLVGSTIRLRGGEVRTGRETSNIQFGGTLILAAPGSTFGLQCQNSSIQTWEGLIVETDGADLTITQTVAGSGSITSFFTNNHVRGSATIRDNAIYLPVTLSNTLVRLGKTLTLDTLSSSSTRGSLRIDILGGVALSSGTNVTLIQQDRAGKLTEGHSFGTVNGLWVETGGADVISAIAANKKGAHAYGDAALTFAAEDAGYVEITGLPTGIRTLFTVGVTNFGGGGIAAVTNILAANTNFTDIATNGPNEVTFKAIAAAGTSYFIWDGVNTLAAEVLSVKAETAATPGAPIVQHSAASSITYFTAVLNGNLYTNGGNTTTVKVFWGPTDGVTSPPWAFTNTLSADAATGEEFAHPVSGLQSAQTYYYRYYATNSAGEDWPDEGTLVQSFTTVDGTPDLTNVSATVASAVSVTLTGLVTAINVGAVSGARVYYGPTDAVAPTSGNWAYTNSVAGTYAEGESIAATLDLTGKPVGQYYYRFYGTNAAGAGWAESSGYFLNGAVTIAKVSDATEGGSGTFRIMRDASLTNESLQVFFCVDTGSSTASSGDYSLDPSVGYVTIAPGATSATIAASAIADFDSGEGTETLVLDLQPGAYAIGGSGSATMNIGDYVPQNFTSRVSGNYSVNSTWVGQSTNPANLAPDYVTVTNVVTVGANNEVTADLIYMTNSAGVLAMPDYAGPGRLNGSTCYLRQGGSVRFGRTTGDYVGTGTVIADDGNAVLEMSNIQNGDVNTRNMNGQLEFGGSATSLTLQVMSGAAGSASPGIGFTSAVFSADADIFIATNYVHLQLGRVDLAAERTIAIGGIGHTMMRTENGTNFAGTVHWNSTGCLDIRSSDALGYSTCNMHGGTGVLYNALSIRNAILNVDTGALISTSETATEVLSQRLAGGIVRLRGGELQFPRKWVTSFPGGTLAVAAPGSSLGLDCLDNGAFVFDGLTVESDGAELGIHESVVGGGNKNSAFTNVSVLGNGTIDLQEASCDLTLSNTVVRFPKTLTITSVAGANSALLGSLEVELVGGVRLTAQTNFSLVAESGAGTFTEGHTFDTSGGLWIEGGGADLVTAMLGNNQGLIVYPGSASFVPVSGGYVTLTNMTPGAVTVIELGVTNFTDIDAVLASLESCPDFSNAVHSATYKVTVECVPSSADAVQFLWDNVGSRALGADLYSVSVGSPADPTPPYIANAGYGATNITASSAVLNGYLSSTGSASTTVYVYWGPTDGGAIDSGLWSKTNSLGSSFASETYVSYTADLTAFPGSAEFYYRYFATNSAGDCSADSSVYFINSPVTIATTADTASEGLPTTAGTVTVTRAAGSTTKALTVNYTIGGTATGGSDYTNLTGSVTIPAGATETQIVIATIYDWEVESPDETVSLTVTTGQYRVGSPSSATVTINELVPLTSGSVLDPSSFSPLPAFEPAAGVAVTFDTDAMTVKTNGVVVGAGVASCRNGQVELAVFCFTQLTLGSGVTVTNTGSRGLALLSRGNMSINTEVNLDGAGGKSSTVGIEGGPIAGGVGGVGASGGSGTNAPPPSTGGDGGRAMYQGAYPGIGMEPGDGGSDGYGSYTCGGAGGGNGGAGGTGANGAAGGGSIGDVAIVSMFGGSGGGGGSYPTANNTYYMGSGGGGGGALQLVAPTVTLGSAARIRLRGGQGGDTTYGGGGGGSGGTLVLAARVLTVNASAAISVAGGNGGTSISSAPGGGGGGGRVAFYTPDDYGSNGEDRQETGGSIPAQVAVGGGLAGGAQATTGGTGSFYDGSLPSFLEAINSGAFFLFR